MGTGPLSSRVRRSVASVLVASLLATGCVSAQDPGDPPDGGAVTETGGVFGRLLPKPLGTVTCEEEPLIFALGWTGMVAGGIAGGTVVVVLLVRGDATGSGEAFFPAVVVGALAGAVVGGVVLTLPVRGIEALWEMLFGPEDAPAESG